MTDGGSRGNPGPSAAAYLITDKSGTKILAKAQFLGEATNNIAEYTAVINSLEAARKIGAKKITILTDSELLTRQLAGRYKVKSEQLRPLFEKTQKLLAEFANHQIRHIRREKNESADRLVNQALNLRADVDESPKPTKSGKKPVRLGILLSGGGRTMVNILEYIKTGRLNAEIALVISSRSTVAGVERARNAGLNLKIVRKKDCPEVDNFSNRLEEELTTAKIDLVIQAGWLCFWKIPKKYTDRVMNIHPALLPGFGGKGMFGHHVHETVLERGCKVSGCTVHFCTNEYDAGPIIVQRCCPVEEDDTADTLAVRVFEQECIAYPQAINLFAEGKLKVENGRVRIR